VTARLTGKQRRYLRGLGHALEPVVQIGKEGLSAPVVAAVDAALVVHELVKIKVGQGAPERRHEAAAQLAERTASTEVQVLGNTVLLYRRHPENPKIELPAASG
jgi:RNA-binding protein